MKSLILSFAAFTMVLGLNTTSQADTEGPLTTSTPVPLTLTDWNNSLAFAQFDPSLGTLESVELDLSGYFQTTLTVNNGAASSSSGNAWTEVQMTVQDSGLNLTAPELDLYSPAYSYALGSGGSTSSGLLSKSGTSDEIYTASTILSEFTGSGTITLSAGTFTQTVLSNTGGNTSASQDTSASLTGDVIYTYLAVPEPGSLALLGLGGAVMSMILRRRK